MSEDRAPAPDIEAADRLAVAPVAGLIDTHAHLDDPSFEGAVGDVLRDAAAVGVTHVINIGYRPARWETTRVLAAAHPALRFALGVHPAHADEWTAAVEAELRAALVSSGAVAVGEAGLDFFRGGPPADLQRAAFAGQIEMAADLGLPLIVHQRAAEDDLIDLLSSYRSLPAVVLHSFDGSGRLAALARERGCWVGVGGLATRRKNGALREVLATIAMDRIILETDSPYLAPDGASDRRNTPAALPIILGAAAGIWGVSPRPLGDLTTRTAAALFGLNHTPVD